MSLSRCAPLLSFQYIFFFLTKLYLLLFTIFTFYLHIHVSARNWRNKNIKNKKRKKILVFAFKAIHRLAPIFIRELISIKPLSLCSLRSNNKLLLEYREECTKITLGDGASCAASPKPLNVLPNAIRNRKFS